MNEDIKGALINACNKALEIVGGQFKLTLEFYLWTKFGVSIEAVYDNPRKFHQAVSELLGEYAAKMLESMIIYFLLHEKGLKPTVMKGIDDFEQVIKILKEKGFEGLKEHLKKEGY